MIEIIETDYVKYSREYAEFLQRFDSLHAGERYEVDHQPDHCRNLYRKAIESTLLDCNICSPFLAHCIAVDSAFRSKYMWCVLIADTCVPFDNYVSASLYALDKGVGESCIDRLLRSDYPVEYERE